MTIQRSAVPAQQRMPYTKLQETPATATNVPPGLVVASPAAATVVATEPVKPMIQMKPEEKKIREKIIEVDAVIADKQTRLRQVNEAITQLENDPSVDKATAFVNATNLFSEQERLLGSIEQLSLHRNQSLKELDALQDIEMINNLNRETAVVTNKRLKSKALDPKQSEKALNAREKAAERVSELKERIQETAGIVQDEHGQHEQSTIRPHQTVTDRVKEFLEGRSTQSVSKNADARISSKELPAGFETLELPPAKPVNVTLNSKKSADMPVSGAELSASHA